MEEAGRLVKPKASLQHGRLNLELKAVAAPLANPLRTTNVTAKIQRHYPLTAAGVRRLALLRTRHSIARLQPSWVFPALTEAGEQPANPRLSWNGNVRLPRHCRPTAEGARRSAPRRAMNSTVQQQNCERSELMEAAAPRASHPYWAQAESVLQQDRAWERLRRLEAAPAGER